MYNQMITIAGVLQCVPKYPRKNTITGEIITTDTRHENLLFLVVYQPFLVLSLSIALL